MYVEQLFTECLAEMAYYIESKGEAVIIDPLRETTPYLELAEKRGTKIKYVFLTHFHADFVSGHLDLANKAGAKIVFGPNAKTEFEIHSGTDGEEFAVGDIKLKLLHTPGHTMESSSYLLVDEKGDTPYVFTGDALFIGDVGRPDLAVKSDLTQEDLAGHLYDSLRNKLMTLPDDTIVYPAHGAGSACGKNMSSETFDTLGNQKATNYALRAGMTKEQFIKEVTTGIAPPPQYFPKNVGMNKGVNKSYDKILEDANRALSIEEFNTILKNEKALIMDVRHQDDFVKGFAKGALFFGIDGTFAPWIGTLIEDLNTPILLIAPKGREEETITRLSRVGYDNVKGYLAGGYDSWKASGNETDSIDSITPEHFVNEIFPQDCKILDVRKSSEFDSEHVLHKNISNSPLDFIMNDQPHNFNNEKTYIHCLGGYRSVIFSSILKSRGIDNFVNVEGGFEEIKEQNNIKLTEYICPSEL